MGEWYDNVDDTFVEDYYDSGGEYLGSPTNISKIQYPSSHVDEAMAKNDQIRLVSASRASSGGTSKKNSGGSSGGNMSWNVTGELPTFTAPTFTAPERNENRLSSLRARASGSALRNLRTQTQAAIQSSYGLPAQARRMTLKEALQGYGSGVSSIMGSADKVARSQYEDEYGTLYKTAQMNYQGELTAAQQNFSAQMNKFAMQNKYNMLRNEYLASSGG